MIFIVNIYIYKSFKIHQIHPGLKICSFAALGIILLKVLVFKSYISRKKIMAGILTNILYLNCGLPLSHNKPFY